jgi:hypothetical protein
MARHSRIPPYTRHNEVLVLDRHTDQMDANYFNRAKTALKRAREQIRFKIPTLNHLDLIVQKDAWIVVDRVLNDMPVVAWTDFQTEGRDNLHEPIPCERRLYHFAARMIVNTTLQAMDAILSQSPVKQASEKTEKVVPLKKDK